MPHTQEVIHFIYHWTSQSKTRHHDQTNLHAILIFIGLIQIQSHSVKVPSK